MYLLFSPRSNTSASKGGRGCLIIFVPISVFICSFVRLTFTVLPLLFYPPAVQIDSGEDPALPLHLVLVFRPSECHKDFHCCVKPPPPAVRNNRSSFGSDARVCLCAQKDDLSPPRDFELQLTWLAVQSAKAAFVLQEAKVTASI